MTINPWDAVAAAIRVAHVAGFHGIGSKGARIVIGQDVEESQTRCVRNLSASRSSAGAHNQYALSLDASVHCAMTYWLRWGQNEAAPIRTLTLSGARFFLTSQFSGCLFVGCESIVYHTAAGYMGSSRSGDQSPLAVARRGLSDLDEYCDDLGLPCDRKFVLAIMPLDIPGVRSYVYGGGGGPPRAVVMGWKSPERWFFAFQEQTLTSPACDVWKALG